MAKWALCLIVIFGLLSCSDQTKSQNDLSNISVETSAASLFEIDSGAQDHIASLRKTARAVSVMNEHEKARAAFKNILDAVETTYPKDSYPIAMALNDYGFILNVIGSTKDALPVHQRAVDMINALPNTTPYAKDRQWRMIANLAETELRIGNISRARDLYAQAYKIPITLPWALPETTTNGDRTLVIIERWRDQYISDPKAMFSKTDYTADPVYQAEVFANQDKGRYMDFGANPAESVRVWKEISETVAKAYHPRSRLATSALGNYGAISYFSDAKELGLSATLAALKQKEKFVTEFWFD
ncbi:MAG: tetratricopeptide repeat protein, partial [Robiginitomaculum sp.]|nr:tetratricopeptide repeat protein [Robiginitomaculum sp.]